MAEFIGMVFVLLAAIGLVFLIWAGIASVLYPWIDRKRDARTVSDQERIVSLDEILRSSSEDK